MKKIKNFKLFEKFADKEGINVGDYFYFDINPNSIFFLQEIRKNNPLYLSGDKTVKIENVKGQSFEYKMSYIKSGCTKIDDEIGDKIRNGRLKILSISDKLKEFLTDMGFRFKTPLVYEYYDFDINKDDSNLIKCKDITGKDQNIRIGRFFKKVNSDLTDAEIEKFVNSYKAKIESYSKNLKIEIVDGEDIRFWYLEENYKNGFGTLNNSCMRYKKCQKKLDLYCDNPKKVKMTIIKNEKNKLLGRALLWKLSKPKEKFYLDRVYTTDDYYKYIFEDFVEKNNFLSYDFDSFNGELRVNDIKTSKQPDRNPYMDTFEYYNIHNNFLTSSFEGDDDEFFDNYVTFDET